MRPWQRRARLAVALIGIACLIVVFVTLRRREQPVPPPPVQQVDPKAVVESTGAIVREVKGARENFKIEAERQMTYPGGGTKLTGVKVSVERDGRNFVLAGREAEVGANQSTVLFNGDVRLAASDGLTATARSATYSDGEGIVRAPGQVAFTRGRLSGTGIGMTYDKNRDLLWLLDQAVIKIAPDQAGAGALDMKSGAAGLSRSENYLQLDRGVTIVREGRIIEADAAMAHLTEDEGRVKSLELKGNSRITTDAATPGSLGNMAARDMNLIYADEGQQLEHATLAGAASMQMAGATSGRTRRVSAESLELGLAPDGTTMTALTGRDRVLLEMPSEGTAPARTIRSASLVSSGDAQRGLTAAKFDDSVEYQEKGGTPSIQRVARSRSLALALGGGFSDIQTALFSGDVRFDDGEVHATAATARYLVTKGFVELRSDAADQAPRVVDPEITVDAPVIDLTLEGPKMTARGAMRSVLRPASTPDSNARSASRKMPGFMQQDAPVFVTADALSYDGKASQAVYTGHARMWQADTTVQADTLNVDATTGHLTGTGNVRSTLPLERPGEQADPAQRRPTIGTARELQYDDVLRRATYRGEAHVDGLQGDLRAETIELYLAQGGHELERVEGYENVSLRQATRTATGTRLTYFSAEERYVMLGAPVRILEGCRETIGKTLTFFTSTDRILVDGNEEIRTQTKSDGDCPEPRFE